MSVSIRLDNYSDNNLLDNSQLNADSVTGATSLTVIDSSGLAANDYLIVGGLGVEGSEKTQLTSVTNSTGIVVPAMLLPHNRFDPITKLFGDKIKVYRAANVNNSQPSDGSFASIATITPNFGETTTVYNDASGSNAYWYKYTYFNSTTSAETDLGDSTAERGAGYNTYCSISEIREEAGLQSNPYITDAMIDAKRYEAQYEIDAALSGLYIVPFQPPINPVIRGVTIRLAAGKVLQRDYGPMSSGNSKAGADRIASAQATLKQIDDKIITLTDISGNEIDVDGAGGIKSWPDTSTSTADTSVGGDNDFRFRISDRY